MKKISYLLILTGLFFCFTSNAQKENVLFDDSLKKTPFYRNEVEKEIQSSVASVNSDVLTSNSSLNFISIFNENTADLQIALMSSKKAHGLFNIGLSQDLSKKSKKVDLLDLNGLKRGTTFSFGWQKGFGIETPETVPIKDLTRYNKLRDEYRKTNPTNKNGQAPTWDDFDKSTKDKIINSGVLDASAFESSWFFTAKFSASLVGFDFIENTNSIEPQKSTLYNKSLAFSLSKFCNLNTYHALTYSLSSLNKSGNEVKTFLFPVGGNGLLYQQDVTIGIPTKINDSRFNYELRRIIRSKGASEIPILGLNPNISALISLEKINIDFPIYFITKNDKNLFNDLQAGIRAGYISKWDDNFLADLIKLKSDKMYFSIFLSKPFSLN